MRYDPALVFVSVVVAVALAFFSLGIRFRLRRWSRRPRRRDRGRRAGDGVRGRRHALHGDGGRGVLPGPDGLSPTRAMSPMILAVLITLIIVLIAAITLVALFAGRQVGAGARALQAEVARRQALEQERRGRARAAAGDLRRGRRRDRHDRPRRAHPAMELRRAAHFRLCARRGRRRAT